MVKKKETLMLSPCMVSCFPRWQVSPWEEYRGGTAYIWPVSRGTGFLASLPPPAFLMTNEPLNIHCYDILTNPMKSSVTQERANKNSWLIDPIATIQDRVELSPSTSEYLMVIASTSTLKKSLISVAYFRYGAKNKLLNLFCCKIASQTGNLFHEAANWRRLQ